MPLFSIFSWFMNIFVIIPSGGRKQRLTKNGILQFSQLFFKWHSLLEAEHSGKYILGRCTPKFWWASTGFIFISFLVFRWWNPFRQWPLHPRFVPLRGHQYFQRHPIWESHHSCGKKGNDYNKVRTIHPFIHSLHHYYKTKFDGRQQTFVDFA